MFTQNDLFTSIIHASEPSLDSAKLVYYIYLYNLLDVDYSLRYRITTSGISCNAIDRYLDELINSNDVDLIDGKIVPTQRGIKKYEQMFITAEDFDKLTDVNIILNNYNEEYLYFICLADILIKEVYDKYGVDGLINQKDRIIKSLDSMTHIYSDETFNNALFILRLIKEMRTDEQKD